MGDGVAKCSMVLRVRKRGGGVRVEGGVRGAQP